MSYYLAAHFMAPRLMRQLLQRAAFDAFLILWAGLGQLAALSMGAHHTWYGALTLIIIAGGMCWCAWDAFDCLRIRRDLRKKMEA